MMRAIYPSEVEDELKFAHRAAEHFAKHAEHQTFTDGEIQSGCLLAIRWGLGEDCVVVVKLDEAHTPTNYMEIARKYQVEA